VTPQELEFQETLIAERETEIREIESGIHELNDIFRDLGTIIVEQGSLVGMSWAGSNSKWVLMWLDNIENNITSVAQNTSSAADELTTAHEYQRKAGRRMACLLVILVIVVAIVLLAVSLGTLINRDSWADNLRSCHERCVGEARQGPIDCILPRCTC
jgi:t-SNARE complex subunit (syntaxin)